MRRGTPLSEKWVLLIFLGVGILLTVGGSIWAWNSFSFTQRAKATKGTIVAIDEQVSERKHNGEVTRRTFTYAPVFVFRDTQGREYTVTASVRSAKRDYELGQEVAVLYDPADPQKASVDSFVALWLGPLALGFLGIVFSGIGLFMIVSRR